MKLSTRTLNRTLLARQHLLARTDLPIVDMVEHLVGLQAQAPIPPYLALWSRLDKFEVDAMSALITDRSLVRLTLMRGTIHLVSAADALLLRPVLQPELTKFLRAKEGRTAEGVELADIAKRTRAFVDTEPRTVAEIGVHLAEHFPQAPAATLRVQAQMLVPMIQVPPRGIWGVGGMPQNIAAATWLGQEIPAKAQVAEVIRRYLVAFGPATLADVTAWSKVTGLKEPAKTLDLVRYTDENGRELLDVPDGVIVSEDEPAPARLLPSFDNVLLSHADRTRIMSEEVRKRWGAVKNAVFPATFTVDGFVRGTWAVVEKKDTATLTLTPYSKTLVKDMKGVLKEARAMLKVLAPGKNHVIEQLPA